MSDKHYFSDLKTSWTSLGQEDPLWAILSDPTKRGGLWDLNEFLSTGEEEVRRLFRMLKSRGQTVVRDRAVDFGCGVGRVTQALGGRFTEVHGLDISEPMVAEARRIGKDLMHVHYHVLEDHRLPFGDDTIDFVYSRMVFQHMNTALALLYIGEFLRILRPKGMAIFQTPTQCLVDGVVEPSEIQLKNGNAYIEMNAHSPEEIEKVVRDRGGEIIAMNEDMCAGEAFASHLFTVQKQS